MRDRYQGGSLAGFIIIGVLLTLVLVGGLYGLNRYNAERSNSEVATEEESKQDEPTETDGSNPDAETESNGREQVGNDKSEGEQTGAHPGNETPRSEASPDTPRTTSLPETGPADTAFAFVILALLAFAGAHYVQSRSRL